MTASYRILISKLDEFIRKYYRNQLVRGALYALSLGLSFYILLVITEYYGDFSIPLRTVLFYSFTAAILFILVKFIVIPLFKLYHIGEVLSYEDAAQIIGKHFSEVQDKLLNVLQLNKQMTEAGTVALLEAGIEQKIREIKPISFPVAIDISRNRRYIPYVAAPLFIILLAWLIVPSLLRQGTRQMFQYNTSFPKVAPFEFVVENTNLKAIQQKDFTLKVKIHGNELPQDVSIQYEGSAFKMEKENNADFEYTFRNVQHDETFTFKAAGYESKEYKLTSLPAPQLVSFEVSLHYPAYIGKKDESLRNTGDLSIPQGTTVQWNFNTNNTDKLQLKFNDSNNVLSPSAGDAYSYSHRFMQSENYSISASNKYFTNYDSVKYAIEVIPDLYPSIDIIQKQDSASSKQLYFNGSIKDDYGFTRLEFIYRIFNSGDSSSNSGSIHKTEISIAKNATQQPFYFYWSMDSLALAPGQQMEYYFEVWDNDGVNGPKSTRTNPMFFKVPTMQDIVKNTEDNNDHIQNDISQTVQQANIMQSEMEQERANLFDKKELNWTDQQKLNNMLQQQLDMQKKMEEIAQKNKENNQKQWDFQKKDSNLMAKQNQLQKLFDELANDSIKKKLEDLQKMLDKMNKDQVQQELQKLSANNEDFKKELERTLELFKRLDFEQQLKQTQQQLDMLAQKQEQLSKNAKNKNGSLPDQLKKSGEQNSDSLNKNGSPEDQLAKQNQQNRDSENKKNSNQDKMNKDSLDKNSSGEEQLAKQEQQGKDSTNKNGSAQDESQKKDELSKDSQNKNGALQDKLEQQNELNKEFEDIAKNLENLDKKNNELEEPSDYKDPKQESQGVEKDMQNSSKELSKNNGSKASKSQHSASQGMQKMSKQLAGMESSMDSQSEQVDAATLRNILNNLVTLSFAQEDLMDKVNSSGRNNMQYAEVAHQQKELQDNATTIEDSLFALSKKSLSIDGIVNQEMEKINYNMKQAVSEMEERQAPQAASSQQLSMTSLNNLALMLSDALAAMQAQMAMESQSPGTGSCTKPGGKSSKPSMEELQKMQEQLSKELDQMKKSLASGKNPGKKPGNQQGNMSGGQSENNSNSEQLAKMAAEQEYIREQMQGSEDEMNDKKQGSGNLGNIAEEMRKNEEDIVNRQITDATLQRQQQIMKHLLEYDKAKQMKGQSPQFESHTAKKQFFGNPNPFLEYNTERIKQDELLKTVPPDLNSFYRDKVNQYFNSFQE